MTREEVGMVLDMIRAHYWQVLKAGENDRALMLRTWEAVFLDLPLRPHIESALAEWFRTEKWPPQASELRAMAIEHGAMPLQQILAIEKAKEMARAAGHPGPLEDTW